MLFCTFVAPVLSLHLLPSCLLLCWNVECTLFCWCLGSMRNQRREWSHLLGTSTVLTINPCLVMHPLKRRAHWHWRWDWPNEGGLCQKMMVVSRGRVFLVPITPFRWYYWSHSRALYCIAPPWAPDLHILALCISTKAIWMFCLQWCMLLCVSTAFESMLPNEQCASWQ